jgi:hypothetical protein
LVGRLKGDTWRKVKVEIPPDEGKAGLEQESVSPPCFAGLGLPTPDALASLAAVVWLFINHKAL